MGSYVSLYKINILAKSLEPDPYRPQDTKLVVRTLSSVPCNKSKHTRPRYTSQ